MLPWIFFDIMYRVYVSALDHKEGFLGIMRLGQKNTHRTKIKNGTVKSRQDIAVCPSKTMMV